MELRAAERNSLPIETSASAEPLDGSNLLRSLET